MKSAKQSQSMQEIDHLKKISRYFAEIEVFETTFDKFPSGVLFIDDKIVAIDLSYVPLDRIPDALWELKHLKFLNLGLNRLKEIPPDIARLENLEELYLSKNFLEDVPPELGELKKLKVLYLDDNMIDKITPNMGAPPNLEILSLKDNTITFFGEVEIDFLSHIRYIDLNGNPLADSPYILRFVSDRRYYSKDIFAYRWHLKYKLDYQGIKYENWEEKWTNQKS